MNKRHVKKRIAAILLALAMVLQAVPVFAATIDTVEGADKTYDLLPAVNQPVGKGWTAGQFYILEVSTGTNLRGGVADNILYFSVLYTTEQNVQRTVVIMPQQDGKSDGFERAEVGGTAESRNRGMGVLFGYDEIDLGAVPAMGSVKTDQFLFSTPEPVKSIDRIQIFGKRTNERSDWACQGIRVYSVETLYGLDMYGWYSQDGYIDFDGTVIAEGCMAQGGGNFRWNNTGGAFNVAPMGQHGCAGIVLVRNGEQDTFTEQYHLTTHVGEKVTSQASKRVLLRLDLADAGLAGFDSLSGLFSLGSRSKISDLDLCEVAALRIRYTDIYDCQRETTLPLIANALGQIMMAAGDVPLNGFAQQSDTVCIAAMLPMYKSMNSVNIITGEAEAAAACGLTTSSGAANSAVRQMRAENSETDAISYLCFAAYTDYTVKIVSKTKDSANLKYYIEAGPGNPVQYSVSSAVDGISIPAKSSRNLTLTTNSGTSTPTLNPINNADRYLVTLSTDNVLTAGTTSDVYVRFKYQNMNGQNLTSPEFSVREYVRSFYGEWPGNVVDFAYQYGMSQGSSIQFIVPMSNVWQISDVTLRVSGNDEWQFLGLSVDQISSVGPLDSIWKTVTSKEVMPDSTEPRFQSHVMYSRPVTTMGNVFTIGTVYQPGEVQPDPPQEGEEGGDNGYVPGTLISDDGMTHTYDGKGVPAGREDTIDWEKYRIYMTYEDTQQNLGFTKERCVYEVIPHVSGDKTNADDDDCGSQNLFYFQLVFEHGRSGCTLANQQLPGDAFRTGDAPSITITTSQDYGDVTEILVIPDNIDGNGDLYDKLKLDYIEVVKKTDSYISPTWTARGTGEDGSLGWIGIEYNDPGELGSIKGAPGHSSAEIGTSYLITENSYTAKFMVGITTAPYGKSEGIDADGRPILTQDVQLAGGITAYGNFFDTNNKLQPIPTFDVVAAMNDYIGRTGPKVRTREFEGESANVDYTVSDLAYQFRPGRTDYFFMDVKDVYEFVDMTFIVKSDVVTNWNISSVKIWLVRSSGIRYINANGEYSYRFAGEQPQFVTEWTREENLTQHFNIYRKLQDTGIQDFNVQFELVPLDIKDDDAWTSTVSRAPKSGNDTFNLFLYPSTSDLAAKPKDYDLVAAVRYTDGITLAQMQTSTGNMKLTEDANGQPVFYALGLNAKNMDAFNGVDVKANTSRVVSVPINYGILQRVRSGVLLETYYLGGPINADIGASMTMVNDSDDWNTQRVFLQVADGFDRQLLSKETKDLAVAVYFRTDDPSGMELRSPYVYLTDRGIASISENNLLELSYNLGYVSEITGVSVVSTGGLEVPLDGIYVANVGPDGSVLQDYSVQTPAMPNGIPQRYAFNGSVGLLNMTLQTGSDEATASSGTDGAVRMTVGYYDIYGVLRQDTYQDIRPYINSSDAFQPGATDTLRMLVPGMAELRWVELEPIRKSAGDTPATWRLDKVTASIGLGSRSQSKYINKTVMEGTPIHIGLADILLTGVVSVTGDTDEDKKNVTSGETVSRMMSSGSEMDISVRAFGSTAGIAAKVENYDPTTGAVERANLGETHGYTREYLVQLISSAESSARTGETAGVRQAAKQVAEIADSMLESYGTLDAPEGSYNVKFKAPRNFTGSDLYYRITVYSRELNDVLFSVDVRVNSEPDLLTNAVNLWRTEQANVPAPAPSSGGGGNNNSDNTNNTNNNTDNTDNTNNEGTTPSENQAPENTDNGGTGSNG